MPRGDQTGPAGAGPMTGRGAGTCAGYNTLGIVPCGGGFGRRANRRIAGFQTAVSNTRADEITALKTQVDQLRKQIDSLEAAS